MEMEMETETAMCLLTVGQLTLAREQRTLVCQTGAMWEMEMEMEMWLRTVGQLTPARDQRTLAWQTGAMWVMETETAMETEMASPPLTAATAFLEQTKRAMTATSSTAMVAVRAAG